MSGDSDRDPLLASEELTKDSVPSHPPPPYQGQETGAKFTPPSYSKPMPLPTYTQSEKYEKDGVLEMELREEPELEDLSQRTPHRAVILVGNGGSSSEGDAGTCCEFTFFFIICAMFSVVGFIFSCCLATTVAAQSGALAGLGVAFISKPILFESWDSSEMRDQLYINACTRYYGDTDLVTQCSHRMYLIMRLFMWLIGVFGLLLLYKGLSAFCKTRGRS